MTLFDAVTGDPLELCVKIAAYYGLRRTCASLLLSQGISIKQIQIWLGHSTFATTADIYAHLDISAQEQSAAAISELYSVGA